jgi:WD40 repeat protein
VQHPTVFAGHEDAVLAARFSPDGKHIVTASRDRTASLWDALTGKPLRRFEEGHEFLVSGAAFFSDGKHLATGAGDNSVRIWKLTAGTEEAVLAPTGRIGTLAVSPDGRWIATGSAGTDVKIWDARLGDGNGPARRNGPAREPVATLSGHTAEISALAFSPAATCACGGERIGAGRWCMNSLATTARSPDCALRRTAGELSPPAVTAPADSGTWPAGKNYGSWC